MDVEFLRPLTLGVLKYTALREFWICGPSVVHDLIYNFGNLSQNWAHIYHNGFQPVHIFVRVATHKGCCRQAHNKSQFCARMAFEVHQPNYEMLLKPLPHILIGHCLLISVWIISRWGISHSIASFHTILKVLTLVISKRNKKQIRRFSEIIEKCEEKVEIMTHVHDQIPRWKLR